jgi:hypothetical protein
VGYQRSFELGQVISSIPPSADVLFASRHVSITAVSSVDHKDGENRRHAGSGGEAGVERERRIQGLGRGDPTKKAGTKKNTARPASPRVIQFRGLRLVHVLILFRAALASSALILPPTI